MTPKQIVCELLGYKKGVSVRRGRGTSWAWIYIKTPEPVSTVLQDAIENVLIENGLVGTYLSDQPGLDIRNANVSWDVHQ